MASSQQHEQPAASSAVAAGFNNLISQGAEARLYQLQFCGQPAVVKERFKKSYRLPELDAKLTQKRIRQEVRCSVKARKAGIDTPCLLLVDLPTGRIYMEHIAGGTVKAWLQAHRAENEAAALDIAYQMGSAVSKLHDSNLVHGDLTTSNFLLRMPERTIVMIDFGLSNACPGNEDKAVDLHLMEKAMASTHPNAEPLVAEFLRAYKAVCRKSDAVLQQLAVVRQRGRKRDMTG